MRYRVKLDLAFEEEADAKTLVALAEKLFGGAPTINKDKPNEEAGYIDYHICLHDESKSCLPTAFELNSTIDLK